MAEEPREGFWNSVLGTITKVAGAIIAVAGAVTTIVQLTGNNGNNGSNEPTPPPQPSITRFEDDGSFGVCGRVIQREQVMTLSRTSGPPGTMLTVSGSGFAADELVELSFSTDTLTKVRADAGGSFSSIEIQIPSDWRFKGQVDIRATGDTCLQTVREPFQVT